MYGGEWGVVWGAGFWGFGGVQAVLGPFQEANFEDENSGNFLVPPETVRGAPGAPNGPIGVGFCWCGGAGAGAHFWLGWNTGDRKKRGDFGSKTLGKCPKIALKTPKSRQLRRRISPSSLNRF